MTSSPISIDFYHRNNGIPHSLYFVFYISPIDLYHRHSPRYSFNKNLVEGKFTD